MAAKDLYLLRHGATGLTGRYIGATDVALTVEGKDQVRQTGVRLGARHIQTIICSPMLRCRQTLEQLALPGDCRYDEMLKEIDFGRWEGKTFAEIAAGDQQLVDRWVLDTEGFCFPGGESLVAFAARVAAFKRQLDQMAEERVLIISHGGVIRHLLCLLLGLAADKYLIFEVDPGCYCSVRLYPEGGVLTGFNLQG